MGLSERSNELTGLHREITDVSADFDPGFSRCIQGATLFDTGCNLAGLMRPGKYEELVLKHP